MVSIWEFPKIGDPNIVPEIDPKIRYPLIFGNSHIGLARDVGECRSDEPHAIPTSQERLKLSRFQKGRINVLDV